MRLLTRSDFDGLVCGALLKKIGLIHSWTFVHPKDLQDGKVEVTPNDVLANVPYVDGCGIWFDHHFTEIERMQDKSIKGERRITPSCARVIFEYYKKDYPINHFEELVTVCDRVDSANLTREEILNPTGGILLGFIMDPRSGLGRFRNFTVSNLALMEDLLSKCAELSVDEILELPDVKERIEVYKEQAELFDTMLKKHTKTVANVIITDLRGVETINSGNRFYIYSLYPEQNVSVWIVDGRAKQNVSIAVGYSILNKTCEVNVGAICASFGGGGHKAVGTCQVPYNDADKTIEEITKLLSK